MKKKHQPVKIFVVEDDPMYSRMVKYIMELNPDHEVYSFKTGKECIDNLHLQPSIISLDYTLPDLTGTDVLRKIKSFNKDITVIILSGQQDIATAVKLLKEGAYDYITKDSETKERILNTLAHIKNNISLKQEVETLREQLTEKYSFDKYIIGNSKPMQRVFNLMSKAIKTNITVSVTGETGTGKEVVAKSIHFNSDRRKNALVAVNMSAIPKDLLESELFGHEKGSFTGAATRKIGKFEQANNGTLFLDEIAEMDVSLQAKLLRALQEREINRIGGDKPVKFNARIIVATHKNLADEVNAGNFREDLYYRLLGLPIELPPLRDRGNDIILLAKFFLNAFVKHNKMEKLEFSSSGKQKLLEYSYPGNVRELKAVVELSSVLAASTEIEAEDIRFNSPRKVEAFLTEEMSLKDYTKKIIYHYLKKYDDNVILVANKLDIGKSTIYRMLKEEKI
jgi:DNA-binding NtrC family response regulator